MFGIGVLLGFCIAATVKAWESGSDLLTGLGVFFCLLLFGVMLRIAAGDD
jgi:hypothetical protein